MWSSLPLLVLLLQGAVLLCLMIRPDGMCIPNKSHQGSGSFPSWTTATLDLKWRYMKFSQSLPKLYTTAGHPGTEHFTSCNTLEKYTTYVVIPSPTSETLFVWGTQMPWIFSMWSLR